MGCAPPTRTPPTSTVTVFLREPTAICFHLSPQGVRLTRAAEPAGRRTQGADGFFRGETEAARILNVAMLLKTALFLLAFAAAPLSAQAVNPSMLVSTDWLAQHLDDENLVILHTGSQKDYDAGHIPGARLVALADISVADASGLRLELPSPEALGEAFGRLGVDDSSRIVVYPGTETMTAATRVWFTLDYLGLGDRASLLDGGLALWRAQGRPLSTQAPPPATPGRITLRPAPEKVVTAEWLRTRLDDPRVDLIDARPADFYTGANRGEFPRGGHIPGARSVPQAGVFAADGTLLGADALRRMMTPAAKPEAKPVTYCNTGQQATVLYFVGRYLGMDVRLYDGSMQDWTRQADLPVESGASPAAPSGRP